MRRLPLMCSVLLACNGASGVALDGGATDTVSLDSSVSADASTCGLRSGLRGKTNRTMKVAGLDRSYIVYLPPDADPQTPLPLVFVHHGYTMSAEAMFQITGYPELADHEGIALAFPDGEGGANSLDAPWNVGANVCPASSGAPPSAPGDDLAFLDAMQADIAADQCIDTAHVFVTGFSMGAYFTNHVGCERPDIRAIAPHSGGTHALDGCSSERKPVIIFHGTGDPIIPVGCADPDALIPAGGTPSAEAWAAHNGCGTTTHDVDVAGGTCRYYDGCPDDGQVALCTFTLMGHCWAGGPLGSIYACPGYESATELEWQFFRSHAW